MSNGWETDNVKGKWRETPDGQCKNKKCPCKSHIDDGYDYISVQRKYGVVCPWCKSEDSSEYTDQGSEEFDVIFILHCGYCGCLFEGDEVHDEGDEDKKEYTEKELSSKTKSDIIKLCLNQQELRHESDDEDSEESK